MKTTISPPSQVKRIAVLASSFLASMGFGYCVVKYCITSHPDFTFLLAVFIGSAAISITLIGSAKTVKH